MTLEEYNNPQPQLDPDGKVVYCIEVKSTKNGGSIVVLPKSRMDQLQRYIKYFRKHLTTKPSPYIFCSSRGHLQVR